MTIRSHHEERRRDQNQQTWNEQRFQRNAVFSWSVSRLIAAARLDSRKFRFHLCRSLTPISYHIKAIFTTSPCRLYFPNDPRATFDPEARAEYFRLARKRDDAPFIMMIDGYVSVAATPRSAVRCSCRNRCVSLRAFATVNARSNCRINRRANTAHSF